MGISENEYQRRYRSIRELMRRDGLDSLLIIGIPDDFNRGNIRYVTGWGKGGCCIFPREGRPIFFVSPLLYRSPKLSRLLEASNLVDLREADNLEEQALLELVNFDNGNKVGLIGQNCIPVKMYLKVKEKFGNRLLETDEFFRPLREIKSSEEIEKIRKAAAVADKVFARLRGIIQPGLSEFEVYGEVKKIIYGEGCEYSFDLLDCAGSMMNMTSIPTQDRLEEDGTLFIEISPAYQGYYAQLPVTLPVGKYLPHIQKMAIAWKEADQAAQKLLHPGTKISDIYKVMVNKIQEKGFLSPLRPGHSLGLDILDFWSITESNHILLKPGMVIAIHPCSMVNLGGDGVGMGYTYLITENGAEKLSHIDLAEELIGE